ncbi:10572_t:CDS:10 [Funneliformis geosporum]|uniref:5068_t:CDS:1 n=1 Tax=Funneliformis geosporum TaxID=1117311 RepID=A0A9W4WP15_9GLOM|nr:10572_t:CDS:10 [Funneliformis geosporum]CAI2168153.1 5068_t:CDS:10 [Funneliformis geosporum]
MRLKRITSILGILAIFPLITNALPSLDKRQESESGGGAYPTFNDNLFEAFLPLEPTPEPITRYYNLTLSRAELKPDGFSRIVWTSNNQYPGPMIRANKGDRMVIYVNNDLDDGTTIHWHGIFQHGTTYYDGVAGQTQCIIPDNSAFIYNFTTGEQTGTYWWHSHFLAQYVDGLRGALIIHDPNDPFLKDYDEEFVMTLSDWYHKTSIELVAMMDTPGYSAGNPVPDSGLITGIGRFDCKNAPAGSKCEPNNPLAVYPVKQGKRYRLRVINTSAEVTFTFSIDEHPLKIIECEGENLKPITLNKINIAIGQRYSVIINAEKDIKNYWIRAQIVQECIRWNPDVKLNLNVTGILRYEGAPEEDPTTIDWNEDTVECRDVDHNLLKLYEPRAVPDPVTDSFTFRIGFHRNDRNVMKAYINNSTFVPDIYDPTVHNIMAGGNMDAKDLEADQNAFIYDTENGVVEIALINENGATHPFHLHGHNFFIMGHGNGTVPDRSQFNMVDPAVRDTVSIFEDSWTVIRFRIDNPGVWAFHCHIEWHVEMGMVGQLIERPSVLKTMEIPPDVTALCPKTTKQKNAARKRYERFYKRNKYNYEFKRNSLN